MKVYCIPGLGFDHRMFRNLDFGGLEPNYIDWIEPEGKESIQSYAKRIAEKIEPEEEDITLVGHSMGGVMSQEIAALRPIKNVILISSIRSRAEMPHWIRAANPLKFYKIFTKGLAIHTHQLWARRHDFNTPEERALFTSMVEGQSNTYLRWALATISVWDTPEIPTSTHIYQAHGTKDRTFPFGRIKNADQVIKGGGHFMAYKRTAEINPFLAEILLGEK